MPKYTRYKTKSAKVEWVRAIDITERLKRLSKVLDLNYLEVSQISCYRSYNSKARAYARIWGLGRLWQIELNQKPKYIIEVISEKFDNLNLEEKDKVIMHEIANIPKNFSGSLVPHIRKRGKRNFQGKVSEFVNKYLSQRIK